MTVLKDPTGRVLEMTGELLPPNLVRVLVDGMITTSQLQEANLGIRAVEGEEEVTVVEEGGAEEEETEVMIVVAMIASLGVVMFVLAARALPGDLARRDEIVRGDTS